MDWKIRSIALAAAVAVAVVCDLFEPTGRVEAQGGTTVVRIRTTATNATADGVVLDRVQAGPAVTSDGTTVGLAYLTYFRSHPGLALLPAHIEIQSGAGSMVIGGLTSPDGRFNQTIGFDTFDGDPRFASANFVLVGTDYYVSYSRLGAGTPTTPITNSHAFDFTQDRVDRQIGDTGLSFRPGNVWSSVPGFGQKVPVGDNPSYSFANLVSPLRQGNVNMLRLTGTESGTLITCFDPTQICGVRGIGDYEGLYGTALSRAPGNLGITANAASDTITSYRDPSVTPNPPGCPVAEPLPAPLNLIAVRSREFISRAYLKWNSVECAVGYVVRVHDRITDEVRELSSSGPSYEADGGILVAGNRVSVAAVAADGTVGQFSTPVSVIDALQF